VGADTVLIHDCDFNPQTDRQVPNDCCLPDSSQKGTGLMRRGLHRCGVGVSQAEDRSHRLGQERPVTIYRLITDATVDADILSIAQV
jgi:SWI/SNF-related matrix-associated actin-dependent regulator of chromatin subfamily A containing DEAD/H box 1